MCDLKIGSLNQNGSRDQLKRRMLYKLTSDSNMDSLFVQETHSGLQNSVDWIKECSGQIFLTHKSSVSGGVAIVCFFVCFFN